MFAHRVLATMSGGLSLTLEVRNTTAIRKKPVCILLALLQISRALLLFFLWVRYGSCRNVMFMCAIGKKYRSQCLTNNAL